MSARRNQPAQLGLDALLAGAERDNVNQQKARECAHLPFFKLVIQFFW